MTGLVDWYVNVFKHVAFAIPIVRVARERGWDAGMYLPRG